MNTPQAVFDLISRMATLAEARDEESLLTALARLATPALADFCILDVVVDGQLRRSKVTHHDPAQEPRATALLEGKPGMACARTMSGTMGGRSQVLTELKFSDCADTARGAFQELGAQSMMLVPLRIAGETIAVVAFVTTSHSGRCYGERDLTMAEELVARVAVLIENLRLREEVRTRDEKIRVALEKSNVHLFEVEADLQKTWLTGPMHPTPTPEEKVALMASVEEAQRTALRTGERTRVEGHVERDGVRHDWVLTHTPVLGPNGEVTRLIGTAVDVTEEKRTQQALSEAIQFRDQVLGILGHDLRNPLSAILGVVGLARLEKDLPARAVANLAQIDLATRRMLEMIGTLLDFSQARFAATLPVSTAATDLRDVGADVVSELRSAHPDRAIEVVTHGDTSGIWDRARLEQVASNLLGNALTHGDARSTVTLSIEDRGDVVDLAVHNRGPAIAEEGLASLFEPFRRGGVAQGDATGARGLGLGLFIARQIVRAHGGTLEVQSFRWRRNHVHGPTAARAARVESELAHTSLIRGHVTPMSWSHPLALR